MKEKIMERVKEHYQYLSVVLGYDVICTILQGSQNYGLDEYSEDYQSDVDTKSIIAPSLDSIVKAEAPISKVEVLSNDEHAEVKDIRIMFEMFKKMNISYIELLYSDYVVINPKWEPFIKEIFEQRDLIASFNKNQFLRCICGMAYEKQKALCHPYPGVIDKIEQYGFDGKQLSHTLRLLEFISRYTSGEPLAACYKAQHKDLFMKTKKQLDVYGDLMSVENAIATMNRTVDLIKYIKDMNLTEKDELNISALELLEKIKYNVIKEKLKREIVKEEIGLLNYFIEKGKYFDEEDYKAEEEVIEKMSIEPKDNIFDYYEEDK